MRRAPLVRRQLGRHQGAGSLAMRGCAGLGVTGPGAASQLARSTPAGMPPGSDSQSRTGQWPFKLGRPQSRAGTRAWRARTARSRYRSHSASGPLTTQLASGPLIPGRWDRSRALAQFPQVD